jgi:hypothetical protein
VVSVPSCGPPRDRCCWWMLREEIPTSLTIRQADGSNPFKSGRLVVGYPVRTFYTSSSRPLPGTGRTAPASMRGLPPAPLPGGRAPEGRRPCAGKGNWATSSGGHLRWRQIVLACPCGVNPAARPDPAGGVDEQGRRERGRGQVAGSGFRVDTARSRQESARIAGMESNACSH